MTLGENNKAVFLLLAVLVLGAGGYLWWMKMYKPAVAARVTAISASQASEQSLQQAEAELKTAQEQVDALKSDAGKADDSVARVTLTRNAIPDTTNIGDAAIVLKHLADRSGIQTKFEMGSDETQNAEIPVGSTGATPTDVTFKAAGTYAEMTSFLQRVQDTVSVDKNKLHVRGRLFNVVSLQIGPPDKQEGATAPSTDGFSSTGSSTSLDSALSSEFDLGPFDKQFTVVIRFYTMPDASATAAANAALAPTTDPNAANGAVPATGGGTVSSDGTPAGTVTTDTPTTDSTGAPVGTGATDTTGATPGGATNTTGGQPS